MIERPPDELLPGAKRAVHIADLRDEDTVLIVSDNARIASALVAAIKEQFSHDQPVVEVAYLPRPLRPMRRMSMGLSRLFADASVVFNVVEAYHFEPDLRHDEPEFRRQMVTTHGPTQRIFHMAGISEAAFTGAGALGLSDEAFTDMETLSEELAVALTIARSVRVTSSAQEKTDFTLDLGGCDNVAQLSTGRLRPGSWGNLPSGESFILPVTGGGDVVIDKAVSGVVDFKPFGATILNGHLSIDAAVDTPLRRVIENDEARARQSGSLPNNVRRVCEFGVGTNPQARPPSFLEIEKIRGTIHIAIGDDSAFGGSNPAPNHIDMVISKPTVKLDGIAEIISGSEIRRDILKLFASSDHETDSGPAFSEEDAIRRCAMDHVVDDGEYLRRRWRDARNNTLEALVGSPHTARGARAIWASFPKPGSRIKRLLLATQESRWVSQILAAADRGDLPGVEGREDALQTLGVMKTYGLLILQSRRGGDRGV